MSFHSAARTTSAGLASSEDETDVSSPHSQSCGSMTMKKNGTAGVGAGTGQVVAPKNATPTAAVAATKRPSLLQEGSNSLEGSKTSMSTSESANLESIPAQATGSRLRRRSAQQAVQKMKPKPKNESKRKRNPPKKEVLEPPKPSGPFKPSRTYYHSNSFLLFKDEEWENDVDSDDEIDQSWVLDVMRSAVNDHVDLSDGEKKMIILWNEFVFSDTVVPASRVPQICLDFVEQHYEEIRDEGLDEELPLHLCNLWDQGLISSHHLSFCLEHYHKLAGSPPVDP